MTDIRLVDVAALRLVPGGTYAIELPDGYTSKDGAELEARLKAALPECQFIVLIGFKLVRA